MITSKPAAMRQKIADLLLAIDEAERPQDAGLFPGWRLHPLKGDLQGILERYRQRQLAVYSSFREGRRL